MLTRVQLPLFSFNTYFMLPSTVALQKATVTLKSITDGNNVYLAVAKYIFQYLGTLIFPFENMADAF